MRFLYDLYETAIGYGPLHYFSFLKIKQHVAHDLLIQEYSTHPSTPTPIMRKLFSTIITQFWMPFEVSTAYADGRKFFYNISPKC